MWTRLHWIGSNFLEIFSKTIKALPGFLQVCNWTRWPIDNDVDHKNLVFLCSSDFEESFGWRAKKSGSRPQLCSGKLSLGCVENPILTVQATVAIAVLVCNINYQVNIFLIFTDLGLITQLHSNYATQKITKNYLNLTEAKIITRKGTQPIRVAMVRKQWVWIALFCLHITSIEYLARASWAMCDINLKLLFMPYLHPKT